MAAKHRPAHLLQAGGFISGNCIDKADIFKFGDFRRKSLFEEAAEVENYMLAYIDLISQRAVESAALLQDVPRI